MAASRYLLMQALQVGMDDSTALIHKNAAVKNHLRNFARMFCIFLIRAYQLFLSPLFPPCCRYTPSCSHYAIEAIACHGPGRGMLMAISRLSRCHPFSKGGFDPVRR